MAVSSAVPVAGSGPDDVGWLVRRAAKGDQRSWDALVSRFGPMVWSIARSMGRSPAEASDVSQTVWLSLVEHLDTILQPERVGAWLATTTRRECLRVQQRAQRFILVDDETRFDDVDHGLGSLDVAMLSKERNEALWDAFAVLPESSQKLLSLLMVDPPMSYQDISSTLDMPIGSIGPTRARVLAVLRREVLRRGITSIDSRL
ncbi:MAG TPA: sigma-70 family RNA polymerase sigma factor [Acidimicrobiales bacterium]|jgi:RNA polymerase sigma factor (sigma-70 family)|nr:sigma-70 family RNA polymerase sigma factor [Acidimicrobiales bacterium]